MRPLFCPDACGILSQSAVRRRFDAVLALDAGHQGAMLHRLLAG
ncbi:MAG: hypothetical protein ACLUUL_10650 [Gemmiger sp.]